MLVLSNSGLIVWFLHKCVCVCGWVGGGCGCGCGWVGVGVGGWVWVGGCGWVCARTHLSNCMTPADASHGRRRRQVCGKGSRARVLLRYTAVAPHGATPHGVLMASLFARRAWACRLGRCSVESGMGLGWRCPLAANVDCRGRTAPVGAGTHSSIGPLAPKIETHTFRTPVSAGGRAFPPQLAAPAVAHCHPLSGGSLMLDTGITGALG